MKYEPGAATVVGTDVTQGSLLLLTCSLADAGIPVGTFKWQMRPNSGPVKNLASVASTFSIASAQREDEGTYICWGTNAIGDGVKGELAVNVNVIPTMLNDAWVATHEVKEDKVCGGRILFQGVES